MRSSQRHSRCGTAIKEDDINDEFNVKLHRVALTGGETTIWDGEYPDQTDDFKVVRVADLPGHMVEIALRPKTKAGAVSLKLGKLRLLKAEGLSNNQASRLFREAKKVRFGLENRVLKAAVNNDLTGIPRNRVKTVKALQKAFGTILCDWYKNQSERR